MSVAVFSQALALGYNGGSNAPLDIVAVPTKSIVLRDDWQPSAGDMSRRAQMKEAVKAYKGDLPKPLKVDLDGIDDNIRTNRIKPFVRTKRSLLFGKPLKMTVDEAGPKEAAQPWCDAFALANRFSIFCKEVKMSGSVAGSAFWKLVEHTPYPRLVQIDPTQMAVITDPQDWSVVIAYVQDYQLTDPTSGNLVDHRHIEYRENADSTSWQIVDKEREAGQKSWGAPQESTWDYAWSPIHACKNLPSECEWWGEPDIDEDLIGLNKALNFVQSNTNRIIKFHATPHTQLLGGASAKAIDFGPGKIIGNLGPTGRLENLEMQSDLASSLAHANDIRESMDELSSVPAVALSRLSAMPRGAMSGVTIAMLYQPALNRTEDERELYGPALEETFSHALELCGMGKAVEVHATWQEVLPRDEQADWTVAQQQLECGVSKHQILEDHNLDYDEQAKWIAEEKEDSAANTPAPLLAFNRGLNQPPMPPTSRGQQPPNDSAPEDSDQTQQGSYSA